MKKNNKLIAEFIGQSFFSHRPFEECYYENMRFHSDWRWIMEVVEKISEIKHHSINAVLEDLSESQDRDGLYTINDVYEAVVEFIKKYNENNLKK